MMMMMVTMMVVSTDMIEKYDRADDDEGGCHLALRSTG